jgi:hypothetical protein
MGLIFMIAPVPSFCATERERERERERVRVSESE